MRGELKPWAHHEIEYLRVNYGTMSADEIAVALGRTKLSVHTKRKRLKLTMTKEQAKRILCETQRKLAEHRRGKNAPNWKGGVSANNTRYTNRFKKMHREKYLAHCKVSYAIRHGKLKKLPCQVCGDPKSESHHEDYSKPLEVIWLCRTHHIAADRTRREREQSTTPSN